MLETLVHLPKAIVAPGTTENVSVAVIAHPWSLLGIRFYDSIESRRKYVRSCRTVDVRYEVP